MQRGSGVFQTTILNWRLCKASSKWLDFENGAKSTKLCQHWQQRVSTKSFCEAFTCTWLNLTGEWGCCNSWSPKEENQPCGGEVLKKPVWAQGGNVSTQLILLVWLRCVPQLKSVRKLVTVLTTFSFKFLVLDPDTALTTIPPPLKMNKNLAQMTELFKQFILWELLLRYINVL